MPRDTERPRVVRQRCRTSNPMPRDTERPRRCPWFADVLRLATDPPPPYDQWRGCALIYAGSDAWSAAAPNRSDGRRACTLLPPGEAPGALIWPPVRDWIGNTGDLAAADALELARCLIDAGAERVQMTGQNLKPSLTMRRATDGD